MHTVISLQVSSNLVQNPTLFVKLALNCRNEKELHTQVAHIDC